MREEKIEEAKTRINENLEKRKDLLIKLRRLNELRANESVLQYLNLVNEINTLKKSLGGFSKSKIVNHGFNVVGSLDDKCSHDLWYYAGSYSTQFISNGNLQSELRVYNEEENGFSFNRYICLDCGEVQDIKDWQTFEKEHKVLKSYEHLSLSTYLNIYHQLLFTSDKDDAVKIVTQQFDLNSLSLERKR